MPDGSVREMTSQQIADETGVSRKLTQRRLGKWVRSWDKLSMTAAQATIAARKRFSLGNEAIFAERAEERAAEAAHLQEIESGHPEI